jgi:TonB family protein
VISDVVVLGGSAFSIPPRGSDLLPPAFRYDEPPSIKTMMPVVYPYEILAGSLPGRASVVFAVGPDGRVEDVSVVRATHPDFGEALAAAMESWEFEPARYAGQPFAALLARSLDFNPEGKDMPVNDTTRRLLFESRKPNPAFVDGADLDEMPATRFGATPRYPGRMGGEAGQAEIEFIIDRTGRVHLPRIVAASAPPFGWAAVTAAAQWEFSPPRKGGQPVDARMRVPVEFPAQARSNLTVIPAAPVAPVP